MIVISNVTLNTKLYIKLSKNVFIEGNPPKICTFLRECNKGTEH